MKVTVCFGNVRVVVPCGDGDILVRDLIREATLRYKKATGKSDSWVSVHNLQSQGGGILDPDDRLSDVVDDREQILASFEDGDGAHHHGGGDGASGSSVGTGSPDIFHDGEHKYGPNYPRTDIEVTGEQIANGAGPPGGATLQVRRGSEPALNQLPVGPPPPSTDATKRWSAAPIILEPPTSSGYASPDGWLEETREEEEEGTSAAGFRKMTRDGSNRLSMQFFGDGAGYRWAEAAERTAMQRTSTSLPREHRRKEPLGQANNTSPLPKSFDCLASSSEELIVIRNEPGPLGIHVVPDYDRLGKDKGLLVQGIEPGGRIDRDGRLAIYDRIVEINGQNLINLPFQKVQDMFKLSLTSPELRLKVIKASGLEGLRKQQHQPPPPVFPHYMDDKENVVGSSLVECEQSQSTNTKVATVSPTKKVPAISKNLKGLLSANTRKIGRKYEIELIKGAHGLGFSITTRDNPAGGNCPIYIKNILPKGAAVEDGRLKIGDRLLEVNNVEMTGKSQAEAVSVLRNAPTGSKVRIVVSRQEDVPTEPALNGHSNNTNSLPRIIDEKHGKSELNGESKLSSPPPSIPPLPQSHLHALHQQHQQQQLNNNNSNSKSPEKGGSVAKIISQFQEAVNNSNPSEKSDDSMVFPWKHREILTFNIPVHDSEKAGLGISVKGKTSGTQDLGIFIKSVINGGAASRDKRLRTNDQLLNVNGISLLQQSNSDAMETLRKAMLHTEGPVPGNITLTIARRASSPANRSKENSNMNVEYQSNESSQSTDNSGASNGSANTVIFNPGNALEKSASTGSMSMNTWNPVLDRLTGSNSNKQLRNESYYKATHDTWSASMLNNSFSPPHTTTTISLNTAEPILIEDEYGSRVLHHQIPQINVHVTNKMNISNGSLENRKDHEPDGKASLSANNNCDNKSTDSSSQATIQNTDATYASQLSLENPQGFSRDAFGRQSMSEKRHATLDAKNTDTYQRTKKLREERIKNKDNADKLGQLGPSLGMKKSSSLESLQTMVQEIQMQEEGDPAYSYRGPGGALKVIRGRGCEESFRAAVVDPNHRSEISAKKHWLLDGPVENEREIDGFVNVRGAPRQSSLNAALDNKHKVGKKKPGLLKGIGSMFRFGKHRKMEFANIEPPQHYHQHSNEFDVDHLQPQPQLQQQQQQQSHSSENHNAENKEKLQDHQIALHQHQQQREQIQQQQQREQLQILQQQQVQREPLYSKHGFLHRHAEQVQVIPENSIAPPIKYRTNTNNDSHRRSHQRLQLHRHTVYQSDEGARENIYDHHPHRRHDHYTTDQYGRPGSRSGIMEAVPFTHYVNYNELQSHLSHKEPLSDSQIVQMRLQVQQQRLKVKEESRKQQQYHSQRQTRADTQLRPVSNYYEYETVQSVLNSRGRTNMVAYTHIQQQQQQQSPPSYKDVNSNSLPRHQHQHSSGGVQVQGRHLNDNRISNSQRGPFVTQVTIGDQQQNGTKV